MITVTDQLPRTGRMTAQFLYDLRTLTGFISGNDLHELFRMLYAGEPSPSGKNSLDLAAARAACPALDEILSSKLGDVCKQFNYAGLTLPEYGINRTETLDRLIQIGHSVEKWLSACVWAAEGL